MKTIQAIRNKAELLEVLGKVYKEMSVTTKINVPETKRAFDLRKLSLSSSAPEVAGYTDAIVDIGLQPKPDNLVLGVIGGQTAIRCFKETTQDDHIVGVVTHLVTHLRTRTRP